MATLTVIFDDEGDLSLSLKSTISFAIQVAENAGFETTGYSNLSEATYLQRPGEQKRLRIAAHGGAREAVVAAALFPQERRLVDGDYMPVVPLQPYQAMQIIQEAILHYDTTDL